MNELVREWVDKAEGDVRTAEREIQVTEGPNWDAVCFHAQQAVEKYGKAALQHENLSFSRTHDLAVLVNLLAEKHQTWGQFRDSMEWLSSFAVEVRYPGESATEEGAVKAVAIMRQFCAHARQFLALD